MNDIEYTKAQRVNILQKSIDLLVGLQSRKTDFLDGLNNVNDVLNKYPPYKNSGKQQKTDRLVVLAKDKIGFGLIDDLPAKEAIRISFSYLQRALNILIN
jgi:hypothetical protein